MSALAIDVVKPVESGSDGLDRSAFAPETPDALLEIYTSENTAFISAFNHYLRVAIPGGRSNQVLTELAQGTKPEGRDWQYAQMAINLLVMNLEDGIFPPDIEPEMESLLRKSRGVVDMLGTSAEKVFSADYEDRKEYIDSATPESLVKELVTGEFAQEGLSIEKFRGLTLEQAFGKAQAANILTYLEDLGFKGKEIHWPTMAEPRTGYNALNYVLSMLWESGIVIPFGDEQAEELLYSVIWRDEESTFWQVIVGDSGRREGANQLAAINAGIKNYAEGDLQDSLENDYTGVEDRLITDTARAVVMMEEKGGLETPADTIDLVLKAYMELFDGLGNPDRLYAQWREEYARQGGQAEHFQDKVRIPAKEAKYSDPGWKQYLDRRMAEEGGAKDIIDDILVESFPDGLTAESIAANTQSLVDMFGAEYSQAIVDEVFAQSGRPFDWNRYYDTIGKLLRLGIRLDLTKISIPRQRDILFPLTWRTASEMLWKAGVELPGGRLFIDAVRPLITDKQSLDGLVDDLYRSRVISKDGEEKEYEKVTEMTAVLAVFMENKLGLSSVIVGDYVEKIKSLIDQSDREMSYEGWLQAYKDKGGRNDHLRSAIEEKRQLEMQAERERRSRALERLAIGTKESIDIPGKRFEVVDGHLVLRYPQLRVGVDLSGRSAEPVDFELIESKVEIRSGGLLERLQKDGNLEGFVDKLSNRIAVDAMDSQDLGEDLQSVTDFERTVAVRVKGMISNIEYALQASAVIGFRRSGNQQGLVEDIVAAALAPKLQIRREIDAQLGIANGLVLTQRMVSDAGYQDRLAEAREVIDLIGEIDPLLQPVGWEEAIKPRVPDSLVIGAASILNMNTREDGGHPSDYSEEKLVNAAEEVLSGEANMYGSLKQSLSGETGLTPYINRYQQLRGERLQRDLQVLRDRYNSLQQRVREFDDEFGDTDSNVRVENGRLVGDFPRIAPRRKQKFTELEREFADLVAVQIPDTGSISPGGGIDTWVNALQAKEYEVKQLVEMRVSGSIGDLSDLTGDDMANQLRELLARKSKLEFKVGISSERRSIRADIKQLIDQLTPSVVASINWDEITSLDDLFAHPAIAKVLENVKKQVVSEANKAAEDFVKMMLRQEASNGKLVIGERLASGEISNPIVNKIFEEPEIMQKAIDMYVSGRLGAASQAGAFSKFQLVMAAFGEVSTMNNDQVDNAIDIILDNQSSGLGKGRKG